MSTPPFRFRPRAGGGDGGANFGGAPQRPQFRAPNPYFVSSSSSIPQYRQNRGFQNLQPTNPLTLDRAEAAVAKAHRDLIAAGESVNVWKLSQNAALSLHADSWGSLGFSFHQVPSLRNLLAIEGKVHAFIQCFVTVRRMTSVHDLDVEICKSEGVEKFDELGLGPLLRHPLVQHYFSVPSDAKDVCKITFEDLISRLSVFLYRYRNKEMKVEEFLDYLVEKHSVSKKEDLGVRIQSLGLYIKFIKGCRRAESSAFNYIRESRLPKGETENSPDATNDSSAALNNSIEGSGLLEGEAERSPVDIPSSSKPPQDDDDEDNLVSNKGKVGKPSTSLGPPTIDDMKLLGIKLAKYGDSNGGKKLVGKEDWIETHSPNIYKVMQMDQEKAGKVSLKDEAIGRFVATWKGACEKGSLAEVLAVMLNVYIHSDKRKRKMQRLFLSYPAVGLLNVAVKSIRYGMLDHLFHNNEKESFGQLSSPTPCLLDVEPPTEIETSTTDCAHNEELVKSVSVDDIVKNVAKYFELNCLVMRRGDLQLEKQSVFRDCEIWLKTQFSLEEFESLGYGTFFEFLDKHASFLPYNLHDLSVENSFSSSSLEVSMLHKQLMLMLSQAAKNFRNDSVLSEQGISIILKKQFPTISFQIMVGQPERAFANLTKGLNNFDASSPVLFSVSLSENFNNKKSSLNCENATQASEFIGEGGPQTSPLGSVSTKDATECLFRAPILSDLQSWSHWDLLFAPSLGPLMEWLLNAGPINELSCLVTRDGRIIKIEQSATFDEFLEAAIQGSSSKAAAKFLSLVCEHGGPTNVPLPLLNCYTRRAIDVIIQNFDDSEEVNSAGDVLGNASLAGKLLTNEVEYGKISLPAAGNEGSHDVHKDVCRINRAYSAVSVFILDFLGHLPPEFRSFAASIFISGLRSFTRGAADIILCQCEQVNQRIMLHDIGWSLGIVEWIKDYHAFTLDPAESDKTEIAKDFWHARKISHNLTHNGEKRPVNFDTDPKIMDRRQRSFVEISETKSIAEGATAQVEENLGSEPGGDRTEDANLLIKTIRCEEFGLDSDLKNAETILLKKQHARLGRALRCLAQELYSQDSHFLLELVQNADDNSYPENVEATLVFILQDTGIIVLNNELGFSEKNIRALCDVGSSTKKGSTAGYIGQKGLGFKSVFRVTDAPEIHSNGFHVKFDITEGQIGFVLPTIIPPFDVNFLKRELCDFDFDQAYSSSWNTCIVLPFRPNFRSGVGMSSIINMFSDLHPSLLLFLHRLKCIVFKNMIDNSLCVMKREILDDGIIMVTHQEDKMTWLVVNQDFPASIIRPDVQTTKISLAFTLQESDDGDYKPCLDQQPAFAFLPLRKYGLKFILQGDFILPSSREEIDGDNAWNQWLLSEYPNLFISAEKSFCSLPCFQESPGKAITTYMSFVPLVGEVQGFFSHLPRMILSKLRLSNCLLMDGMNEEWVPPSKVLRGWDEQARSFLSDSLLQQHLGLGYLRRDIILPDSLAKALGIQEYGPKFLVDILSSLCHAHADVRSLGTEWISSWLNALYNSLAAHSLAYLKSVNSGMESKLIDMIRELPFIPLSDGSYSSLAEGPIWLPFDASVFRFEGEDGIKHFSSLFSKLRIVTPHLFPLITNDSCVDENRINNLICILSKIGVQKLAAHDIIIELILPSMSNEICTNTNVQLMIEYLCFIMIHLQSACSNCHTERAEIISKLQTKAIILTNQGFKCPLEESVHFSKDYGNVVDVNRLIDNTELKWIEVDDIYLKHPSTKRLSFGMSKWREFFLELGVTDFVKVIYVANSAADLFMGLRSIPHFGDHNGSTLSAGDWQSHELIQLLSALSTGEHLAQCKYLLEVLNKMWDDYFSAKAKKDNALQFEDQKEPLESSFMKSILNTKWVPCSLDDKVYYPRDVFHDCEAVRSILGSLAPYAVPKVSSKKFLADIGFKVQVTLVDALRTFKSVKFSDTPSVSISQMSKLYTFIQEELATWKGNMEELRTSLLIFIPNSRTSSHMDVAPGKFLSPDELCWHDPTGCVDWMMKKKLQCASTSEVKCLSHITVSDIYPSLHDFFVNDCGMPEVPPFGIYLEILLLLSTCASPSEVAHEVFQVFVRWTDDFRSGSALSDDINNLRDYLLKPENMILPTMQDKWVSLHPSHGIVCWSGDEELMKQYSHSDGVCLLDFGELTSLKKEMLQSSVASLMQQIGIPALSEVLSREAIFYGISNNTEIASLVDWILPCAQRYVYKKHPDVYFQLKEAGFESLIQLQIIVVEKLFYKNSLKGRESANNKRFECSCLLQGNILYTTDTADSHTFFLELSRYFFHGITELHMANFLHMVATMLDLGSTNDQIESFIVHNQKVSELPDGESIWSLSRSVAPNEDDISVPLCGLPMIKRQHYPRVTRNPDVKRSWPPTNWENAPIFQFASNTLSAAPEAVPALSSETVPKNLVETAVLKYNDGELFMGGNSSTGASNFAESESIEQRAQQNTPDVNEQIIANVEPAQTLPAMNSVPIPERLCWEIQEVNQSLETGRLGEMIAYEYFSEKLGSANVVWVNRESESGLPYDLIVNEANRMYVEVKSTRSINKDWFPISANEWHCAAQKGNSFSIVWVNLWSPAKPKILILKNPLRLCQENLLQLAILLSSKTENSNT